jgi:mannitol/fructose-specific phosphotransferase system IIA component (Ntr-type)
MPTDSGFLDVVRRGCVLLNPQAATKGAIIAEMVDALANRGLIRDRSRTLEAVLRREETMSTGMQHGVAIPHAKTDTVDDLVAAIAIKRNGIEFASLDGQPATILVMTISSVLHAGPHMRFLSAVGRLLERPSVRARLLAAERVDDVFAALAE